MVLFLDEFTCHQLTSIKFSSKAEINDFCWLIGGTLVCSKITTRRSQVEFLGCFENFCLWSSRISHSSLLKTPGRVAESPRESGEKRGGINGFCIPECQSTIMQTDSDHFRERTHAQSTDLCPKFSQNLWINFSSKSLVFCSF